MNLSDAIQKKLSAHNPFELRKDARALVIGLGGSGLRYVSKTKELLVKRYGEENVLKIMDFYAIDADEETKFPPIFVEAERQRITGIPKNEWTNSWRHPDLDKNDVKPNSAGAGGFRQVGRWKLFGTDIQIMQHLDGLIGKYKSHPYGNNKVNKFYIFVISSISGGCGCGTFIDVPYFVRKAIKNNSLEANESIFEFYGILEMPDSVIARASTLDLKRQRKCWANAYAALKDLYYYMDKDVKYEAVIGNSKFEINAPVFNNVFLVSNLYTDTEKKVPLPRNPEYGEKACYLDGAIPEFINSVVSDPKINKKEGETHFDFDSAMDNFRTDGYEKNDSLNWRYGSTFGVSKIETPLLEMVTAIYNRIFLSLQARWIKITDEDLIRKTLAEEIAPRFRLNEIRDVINQELFLDLTKDKQLKSDDFLRETIAQITVIEKTNKNYREKLVDIKKGLQEAIDSLYELHGPILVAKILEEGIFTAYLNFDYERMNPDSSAAGAYNGDIAGEISDYNNYTPLFNRDRKREKRRKALLEHLETYIQPFVYQALGTAKEDIRKYLGTEQHSLYTNIKNMLNGFKDILVSLTGIETLPEETANGNLRTYSWDFSQVPLDQVDEKIRNAFYKKVQLAGIETPSFTKDHIYEIDPKGNKTKNEIFYLPARTEPLTVYYDGGSKQVLSIEEVLSINSVPSSSIPLESFVKKFLLRVKDCNPEDKDAVPAVMVEEFESIINQLSNILFEDMIVYSSPGQDLSKTSADIDDEVKKDLFEKAISDYKRMALPAFPVHGTLVAKAMQARNSSSAFEPIFGKPVYGEIMKKTRDQIIPRDRTEVISRKNLSMMITVNIYFDYEFGSYVNIRKCREEYEAYLKEDREKGTFSGVGFHIDEGPGKDIRPSLEEITEVN
jgi:hypothetical protein